MVWFGTLEWWCGFGAPDILGAERKTLTSKQTSSESEGQEPRGMFVRPDAL